MEMVKIIRLDHLPQSLTDHLHQAQEEAALVWNECVRIHQQTRSGSVRWLNRDELQKATRGGRFDLHSQTMQITCHACLANVETSAQLKHTNPKMRYPYKEKHFYPLMWLAQKVPDGTGACKIVLNAGYELHVMVSRPEAKAVPGGAKATIDLGEVHQAAATTNTGAALMGRGREIRSIKCHRHQQLGEIAKLRARCQKGSRRWRKLQWIRAKVSTRVERQIRDLCHKGTCLVVDFCVSEQVETVPINVSNVASCASPTRNGEPRAGVMNATSKSVRPGALFGVQNAVLPDTGTWLTDSINMYPMVFDSKTAFPQQVTYLRPGDAPKAEQATGNKQPGRGE